MMNNKVCNGASNKFILKNVEEAENVSPTDIFATKQPVPVICVCGFLMPLGDPL